MFHSRFRPMAFAALVIAGLLMSNSRVLAAKDVFYRTKPHVNVGAIDGVVTDIWVHAQGGLLGNGKANGIVQVMTTAEDFLYRVTRAIAIVEGDTVIGLDLVAFRVGKKGDAGDETTIIVRRSTTIEDCLIYDIVGPNVHIQFEAEGAIHLRDPSAAHVR